MVSSQSGHVLGDLSLSVSDPKFLLLGMLGILSKVRPRKKRTKNMSKNS